MSALGDLSEDDSEEEEETGESPIRRKSRCAILGADHHGAHICLLMTHIVAV